MDTKNYNTTDLDPKTTFERHVFHRDQFAHYIRWTHVLKYAKIGDIVVDFGCGKANLLEVLYRNRFKCKKYIGIDIREKTILNNIENYKSVDWAEFYIEDTVSNVNNVPFENFKADKVVSFEVLEHIGKSNAKEFLVNFKKCGNHNAIYFLSTPNYDSSVGAAENHTYDCGDGLGKIPQEFDYNTLRNLLLHEFDIMNTFGTFASIKDYKNHMNDWQKKMYNELRLYFDTNLLSNIMAPFFPMFSRNCLWVLKRKNSLTKNIYKEQLKLF